MNRAVLMTSVDPFVALLGYHFSKNYIDEIDKLYILCGHPWKELGEFVGDYLADDPKVVYKYLPQITPLDKMYNTLLDMSHERNVMFLEDDGFILKKGAVGHYFNELESGKYNIIGSPRASCTPGIWNQAKLKFKLNYEGAGDKGPNFWPCFLYTNRQLLEDTDRYFGDQRWEPHTYMHPLDWTTEEEEAGDTFVWMSLQMRALTGRILEIPQNKTIGNAYKKGDYIGDVGKHLDWIHAGSLSSGIEGFFDGNSYLRLKNTQKEELESRAAWWNIAMHLKPYDGVKGLKKDYVDGWRNFVQDLGLDTGNINKKISLFSTFLV